MCTTDSTFAWARTAFSSHGILCMQYHQDSSKYETCHRRHQGFLLLPDSPSSLAIRKEGPGVLRCAPVCSCPPAQLNTHTPSSRSHAVGEALACATLHQHQRWQPQVGSAGNVASARECLRLVHHYHHLALTQSLPSTDQKPTTVAYSFTDDKIECRKAKNLLHA